MGYQEPDFLPWDGRRVPVTLLGGYLGAGKTTLINRILTESDRAVAVLVNDVGAINVDARLLRRRSETVIEFTDGCVCCSLSDGLGRAFDTLRAAPRPPDHVVLELSGVAEPSRVVPWTASAGFGLDGVVIAVDAADLVRQLADPVIGPTVQGQVRAADVVVLTKLDLATRELERATRREVDALAPGVPILDAGQTGVAGVLALGARRDRPIDLPPPTLFDVHQTSLVPLPSPGTEAEIRAVVDALPDDVLRAKGIAMTPDGHRWLIQVVGRRRRIEPLPQAEDHEPTDLVVIRPRRPSLL